MNIKPSDVAQTLADILAANLVIDDKGGVLLEEPGQTASQDLKQVGTLESGAIDKDKAATMAGNLMAQMPPLVGRFLSLPLPASVDAWEGSQGSVRVRVTRAYAPKTDDFLTRADVLFAV